MTTTVVEPSAAELQDWRQRVLERVNVSMAELEQRESAAELTYRERVALTTARGIDTLLNT